MNNIRVTEALEVLASVSELINEAIGKLEEEGFNNIGADFFDELENLQMKVTNVGCEADKLHDELAKRYLVTDQQKLG